MAERNIKKKTKKQSKFTSLLKLIVAITVMVLLLFVAAETFGGLTSSKVSKGISNYFGGLKRGDGYPYKINSNMINDAEILSSNLFLLTDMGTITLDSTAKIINSAQNTFTRPAMEISGDRAIIYDLKGNHAEVRSAVKAIHEDITAEKRILTAAIGKKGNIAIASYSDMGSKSSVTVYNKKLKKIYIWNCAEEYVVDIALSDDGNYMAVAAIGSLGADIYSKVYVFGFKYNSEISSFDYMGTALFDIQFNGTSTIIATGDNLRSVIKNKKNKGEDIKFNTSTVTSYAVSSSGRSAIVLSESGSINSSTLYFYNSNGKVMFEEKLNKSIKDIDCTDQYISVLYDDAVVTYSSRGRKLGEVKVNPDVTKVILNGKKLYLIATNEIRCSKIK